MRKAATTMITAAFLMLAASSQVNAEIAWQTNLRSAHAQAQAEGKLLLMHFYSDNCLWCDRLEEGSFKAPQVSEAIGEHFIPVKIHAGRNPKLTEMFKVTKFPTDVIVTIQGQTLSHSVSPQVPDRYVAMLTSALPTSSGDQRRVVANTAPPASGETPAGPDSPGSVPEYAQSPASAAPDQTMVAGNRAGAVTAQPAVGSPTARNQLPSRGLELPSHLQGATGRSLATAQDQGLALENPTQNSALAPARSAANVTTPAIAAAPAIPAGDQSPSSSVAGDQELARTPELAMQGFCPVTVIKEDRWAEGNPQFGVIHLGRLYLFVNAQAMQTFLDDPAPYTPVLNEIDVVRFFEERKIVAGKREWGVKDPVHNRMFFFADEAARNHFENTYERYTDAAIQVMQQAIKDSNPGS